MCCLAFTEKKFTQIFVVRNKGTFRVTFALEIHNSNTLSSRTFSCLLHCLKMKCDWKWSIFGFVSFSTVQCFLKIAIDKIVSRITVRVTNTESVKLNFTHITEEARLDQTLKLNSWPEVTSQSHTAGATYGRFKTQQRRKLLLCLKRSDWTKDQRIICKGWLVERSVALFQRRQPGFKSQLYQKKRNLQNLKNTTADKKYFKIHFSNNFLYSAEGDWKILSAAWH